MVEVGVKIPKRVSADTRIDLLFERAMKPFEFALCLRMIRPPMTGFDAEAE